MNVCSGQTFSHRPHGDKHSTTKTTAMKNMILIVLFAAVAGVGSAFGQAINERNKNINYDEVPAAVKQAFLKDHSDLEDKGYWRVYYTEKTENGKTVFTPEKYTFSGKKDGEKVSFTYAPDGTLENPKEPKSGSR
jgi:hypothetical protein